MRIACPDYAGNQKPSLWHANVQLIHDYMYSESILSCAVLPTAADELRCESVCSSLSVHRPATVNLLALS